MKKEGEERRVGGPAEKMREEIKDEKEKENEDNGQESSLCNIMDL